jgi:photosystem II stability/assembly factor-like uncharacterized protein
VSTVVYAGTESGGVFRSPVAGSAWSATNTGLTNTPVLTLAVDPRMPTTVYAGTLGGGIFKSTDGGGHWSAGNTGLTNTEILSLAIDPETPTILYASTHGGRDRLFKTTDGGATWTIVGADLTSAIVSSLAIDPRTPTTVYAGTLGGGIVKSTDGGGTWSAVNTGLSSMHVNALAIDPQAPTVIYAGTQSDGVFKSTDGGSTWSAVNTGLTNFRIGSLAIDPQAPTVLYAGSLSAGVFKSTDGGATWSAVNTGLTATNVNALAIDPRPPTVLYAGTQSGGVFKSSDGGGHWRPLNTGLIEADVRAVAIDLQSPNALYAGMRRGVFALQQRDEAPPTVEVTSPSDGATASGTLRVAATASDDVGVAGVQFLLDGTALGAEDTTAPYEGSWDTRPVPDGTYTLTARARDAAGFSATSVPVTVTVANGPVARFEETAATLAPAEAWPATSSASAGVMLSEDRAVAASAAGATATFTFTGTEVTWVGFPCEICGIASVHLDGALVGTVDTFAATRPAASGVMFTASRLAATSHTLVIEATGTWNPSSTAGFIVVDAFDVTRGGPAPGPSDSTPPTVTMTAPSDGATVAGTIPVSATASDDVGVAGVQFLLDGVALGAEDTTAPYEASWDTGTVPNGTYTLTAQARDAAGSSATSAPVTVTVANERLEETAATLTPAEAWSETTSASVEVKLSGARAVFASAAGATATFTFTGTGVSWLGFPCEACGLANVLLDGARVGTMDTFAATRPAASRVLFTASGLAATSHTLVIEVTGTWNPSSTDGFIVVDAFDVTNGGLVPAPSDSTPPTVTMTAPSEGATVDRTITVSASASDDVGVAGVHFLLDGVALGAEDTVAPYEAIWDTRAGPDGTHTLTARVRDAAGHSVASAPVTVTVANGLFDRFEETAATLAPAEAWSEATRTGADVRLSGDRGVFAAAPGATATFTFTGTGVSWLGFPCELCGIADVLIDGARVATVDTFASARPAASTVMFTTPRLAAGSHTLVIEVTGTANASSGDAFIVVDAFDVTP